jgi:hypothetical protein
MIRTIATNRSSKRNDTKKKKVNENDLAWIDPTLIRFQHSRIRPIFSSCGRTIEETLNEIRSGKIKPCDIPPIQVLINPSQGNWYFTLNNRRLYVFKKCLDEGLLKDTENKIPVRIRNPKSSFELSRYTVDNCSLCANIIETTKHRQSKSDQRQPPKSSSKQSRKTNIINDAHPSSYIRCEDPSGVSDKKETSGYESEDSSSESADGTHPSWNRFDAFQV